MESATQLFAKCLSKKALELKMLRTGIIHILRKLSELKTEGAREGNSVDSNNGNIGCLKVATAMIEEILESLASFVISFIGGILSKCLK
jgi:hypothetical protein